MSFDEGKVKISLAQGFRAYLNQPDLTTDYVFVRDKGNHVDFGVHYFAGGFPWDRRMDFVKKFDVATNNQGKTATEFLTSSDEQVEKTFRFDGTLQQFGAIDWVDYPRALKQQITSHVREGGEHGQGQG